MAPRYPVFEPALTAADTAAVVDALGRGEISGTFGEAIPAFERAWADVVGVRHGIATSNGTTALQLAVLAAGIGPGDEVLISASTNIATALAVAHAGAVPVCVDSEDDTWNLDVDLLAARLTPKTRAILPVHLFGHPVDMDRLMAFARAHELVVIEDCAESHGATVRGRQTGSFGAMGCFSFYANKIITTGEGGMVVTDDDVLADKVRLLRNLGFQQPRFVHEVLGFNFRLTGMQAALGVPQVARLPAILAEKERVAARYRHGLVDVDGVRFARAQPWAAPVTWMVAVELTPAFGISRDELCRRLATRGIETRTFFCPMNQQPGLRRLPGFDPRPCPVADRIWQTGLYLPSSPKLANDDVDAIVAAFIAARTTP